MLLRYDIGGKTLEKDVPSTSFVLANRHGGFLFLGSEVASKYNGVFFNANDKTYKVIEDIHVNQPVESVTNKLWCVERKRRTFAESFFMPENYNSLIYETTAPVELQLVLDIREPYDTSEWGRYHKIEQTKDNIVIKYTKKNDANEIEMKAYLVITGKIVHAKEIEKWVKHDYQYDRDRHDPPYQRHVFNSLKITASCLVFTFGVNLEQALKESKMVYKTMRKLKKQKMSKKIFVYSPQDFASQCCTNSLRGLCQFLTTEGMYAGLPWFFKFWTRDELICAKALSRLDPDLAKKIIFRHADHVGYDGKLPSIYPLSDLAAGDAPGWLLIRALELTELKKSQREKLVDQLHHMLYLILKFQTRDDYFYSGPKETWMDSGYANDDRAGFCIEMQAMLLFMLKTMFILTGNKRYKEMEDNLREKVRLRFWNEIYLADRLLDFTARPNVFLAAYFYPDLLTKAEWTNCFQMLLSKLWLEWGGLSTIDKTNQLFCGSYTGADNRSYHRGDSWYYMNNLAAIVLLRTDKFVFNDYIQKIVDASTREILWKGASGHHAELSNAGEQTSNGCLAQAWSAALYLELLEELKK